ncbi:MAG TPA: hypothetical protein VM223_00115 [Planctomycetota bacterium]|nr:hypothetical protein [Planctomycetota bacterium]
MQNKIRNMAPGLAPADELSHFKAVVRSLMNQAESILAEIELSAHGKAIEDKIAMLDHCLDYTRRLCEPDSDPCHIPAIEVDSPPGLC